MNTQKAKSILIIEDATDILFTLKTFLENEHYTVHTAQNGSTALEILKNIQMPNLILLDMKMPVMNGWEFAKEFKEKYEQRAPIVVMTAAADAELRAKDISAEGWVSKPFDLDILLKMIQNHESKTT